MSLQKYLFWGGTGLLIAYLGLKWLLCGCEPQVVSGLCVSVV